MFLCCSCSGDVHDITFIHVKCHFPLSFPFNKFIKYLGITISNNFSWNNHINNIEASANQAQGMLRRNIKKAPQHTKAMAVNTLIRPKVEYSSAVWDPYTKENIDKIERVQRRAARYVYNNYYCLVLNNWKDKLLLCLEGLFSGIKYCCPGIATKPLTAL
jgi:hypothetical protein